jgi:hypothetical protein
MQIFTGLFVMGILPHKNKAVWVICPILVGYFTYTKNWVYHQFTWPFHPAKVKM